jgi:hypothetical protein
MIQLETFFAGAPSAIASSNRSASFLEAVMITEEARRRLSEHLSDRL